MVSAMMAQAMHPLLRDVSEVRARILNIDGNGSGRLGVLQQQDIKMQQMAGAIDEIRENVATLVMHSQSWSKKRIWELTKWIVGGLFIFGTGLLSMYIGHQMGWR